VKVAWAKNVGSLASKDAPWNCAFKVEPEKSLETKDVQKPDKEKVIPFWPAPLPDPPRKDHMKKAEVVISDGNS
jgi:hypothetical protein